MANVPVEVKKTAPQPAPTRLPETWRSFRQEMDRMFDRFSGLVHAGSSALVRRRAELDL